MRLYPRRRSRLKLEEDEEEPRVPMPLVDQRFSVARLDEANEDRLEDEEGEEASQYDETKRRKRRTSTRRAPRPSTATATATALFLLALSLRGVEAIGCFVCSSFNGSNPACEDPFNSTLELGSEKVNQIANYHHPCWSFKKGRQGLFPADHCIKINGYRISGPFDQRHTMVIRTCALDSGTLTADTEIVRISHCGHFKFEGHQYTGCVQACDSDGCNSAHSFGFFVLPIGLILFLSRILMP